MTSIEIYQQFSILSTFHGARLKFNAFSDRFSTKFGERKFEIFDLNRIKHQKLLPGWLGYSVQVSFHFPASYRPILSGKYRPVIEICNLFWNEKFRSTLSVVFIIFLVQIIF